MSELEESFDPQKSWPDRQADDSRTHTLNRKMRISWGLVHLKLELEEYAQMSAEDNRDVTVLQWEAIEHEFDIEFPTDEPLLYPVPVMGLLKGEGDMEPYGRCWELLKYFSSVQGPIWESRFGTVVKIRNAPLVSESNMPQWMKPDSEESAKDPVKPSANPEDFSHPIHVKLNWEDAFPCPELQELKMLWLWRAPGRSGSHRFPVSCPMTLGYVLLGTCFGICFVPYSIVKS
jgi:hypothetical protein